MVFLFTRRSAKHYLPKDMRPFQGVCNPVRRHVRAALLFSGSVFLQILCRVTPRGALLCVCFLPAGNNARISKARNPKTQREKDIRQLGEAGVKDRQKNHAGGRQEQGGTWAGVGEVGDGQSQTAWGR